MRVSSVSFRHLSTVESVVGHLLIQRKNVWFPSFSDCSFHSSFRSHRTVTTPEKWDGVSRSWRTRAFVREVGLVIMDEIHLLGQDRGPVLEVIVSRMRFISEQLNKETTAEDGYSGMGGVGGIRLLGLSTALVSCFHHSFIPPFVSSLSHFCFTS